MAVSPVPAAKRKAAREKPEGSTEQHAPAPADVPSAPRKRTKDPGVRVVGGRIYDSHNGKTCHQCRQKTMDFFAPCRNERNGKPCPICFCHKCLLNRYGEKAEEVAKSEQWSCPKCRGVCNCSFCMKRRGQEPTGILVHTAKASGFSSVCDLLHNRDPEAVKELVAARIRSPISSMKSGIKDENKKPNSEKFDTSELEAKTSHCDGIAKDNLTAKMLPCNEGAKDKIQKKRKRALKMQTCQGGDKLDATVVMAEVVKEDEKLMIPDIVDKLVGNNEKEKKEKFMNEQSKKPIKIKKKKEGVILPKHRKCNITRSTVTEMDDPLPEGSILTTVEGLELAAEDVGPVLQFLEFCTTFEKVLGLKKGHAKIILSELLRGPVGRRGLQSSIVLFHIKLLSIILKDNGKKLPSSTATNDGLWLQALGNCISNSDCVIRDIPTGILNKGIAGYNTLGFSEKVRLLNFLCDEALVTGELRCWIDEENVKFNERKKEEKKNNIAAKEKKKSMKQKLKDRLAQALLSTRTDSVLTQSEHDNLVSIIKEKTEEIHAKLHDSVEMPPRKRQCSDAVRAEPALLEGNGRAFWRLKCCENNSGILLQDVGSWGVSLVNDKWFIYDDKQQKVVEKHLMLVRKQRLKRIKSFLHQEACLLDNASVGNNPHAS